jgi:protein-S-isoprenylcysteine O-methyltransferase Ste14
VTGRDVETPLWQHLRAIAVLPGMVLLVIPATILYFSGSADLGLSPSRPWNALHILLGCGFVGLGVLLMATSIALLHRVGMGTLAPWDPTGRLVVLGIYQHVRNPMISGVFFILLGEVLIFDSFPLLVWFCIFLALNLVYIPIVEEPGLERRFGKDYEHYERNVPRWIPRLRPWKGLAEADRGRD